MPARGRRARGRQGGARARLVLRHEQVEAARAHGQADAIAALDQAERAADRRFGRDVEHDRAKRGAAHARIRDPDHVLDARARGPAGIGR